MVSCSWVFEYVARCQEYLTPFARKYHPTVRPQMAKKKKKKVLKSSPVLELHHVSINQPGDFEDHNDLTRI